MKIVVPTFIYGVFIYGVLAGIALCLAAMAWEHRVVGVLYVCTDSVPILDFIPPFVHSGPTGDVYLVPEALVYLTWDAYVAVSLLVPAVPFVLCWVLYRRYWMYYKKKVKPLA